MTALEAVIQDRRFHRLSKLSWMAACAAMTLSYGGMAEIVSAAMT